MQFFPAEGDCEGDDGRHRDVVVRLEVRVPVGAHGVRVRTSQENPDPRGAGSRVGLLTGTDLIEFPVGPGWPAVWCTSYPSAGSNLGFVCAKGTAISDTRQVATSVQVKIFEGDVLCDGSAPADPTGAIVVRPNQTTGVWLIEQLWGVKSTGQHSIIAWADFTNYGVVCEKKNFTVRWERYTHCSYPAYHPCPGDSGGGGAVSALFSGMPLVLPPTQRPSGSPPPGATTFETIPYAWQLTTQGFTGAAVSACNGAWRLKLCPGAGDQIVYRCEGDMVGSPQVELRTDVVGASPWRLSFTLAGRRIVYQAARAGFNPFASNAFTLAGMEPCCAQSSLPYVIQAEPIFPK